MPFSDTKSATTAALLGSRKLTARDLARLKKESNRSKGTSTSKKRGGARQIQLLFEEMKARMDDPTAPRSDGPKGDAERAVNSLLRHHNQGVLGSGPSTSGSIPSHHDYSASTNLYVGNLPLNICEAELAEIFGRFGIIASVKIMWPRTQEEHNRDRLCGFVSYARRCDAEMALSELRDHHLFGERLRLGWGKPVLGGNSGADSSMKGGEGGDVNLMPTPTGALRYAIRKPTDERLMKVIDRTAVYVAQFGSTFERSVIESEGGRDSMSLKKGDFKFLVVPGELNLYYRWRVYSLSMGDSLYQWRRTPFQIIQNGPYWIPPMMDSTRSIAEQVEDDVYFLKHGMTPKSRRNHHGGNTRGVGGDGRDHGGNGNAMSSGRRGCPLNSGTTMKPGHLPLSRTRLTSRPLAERDRTKFMSMLRALNCKRFKIKEAMIFCLDHSDRAVEVCEILAESLTLKETVFSKKLARLLLVSDVLCNCTTVRMKNASLYRSEFKNKHLAAIFKSLHVLYDEGKEKAMKEKVLRVIRVWDSKCVFPSFFTSQLTSIFISGEKQTSSTMQSVKNLEKTKGDGEGVSAIKKGSMEEKNKNLIYPKHSKLYIAKKGNDTLTLLRASSFQKGKKGQSRMGGNEVEDEGTSSVFSQMVKGQSGFDKNPVFQIKAVGVGQYDGEPLDESECVDIELL